MKCKLLIASEGMLRVLSDLVLAGFFWEVGLRLPSRSSLGIC